LLGTVTFTSGPGQSGWQQMTLGSPVALQVGATYIVSYNTADNYISTDNYFTSAVTDPSGKLVAPSSAASGGNGVYAYGSNLFPTQNFGAANYWVDVAFNPSSATSSPSGLLLDPASDSGSTGDNVTNRTALVIDGATDPGVSVTLLEGTKTVGTGIANSSGAFQITTSTLADGVHTLTANVGTTTSPVPSPLTVTVDTAAPVAPANLADAVIAGGVVSDASNTASQALTGRAEAGATVAVFDASTRLGTVTADASTGQWSYTLGRLGAGSHSLTAQATDRAGNVGPASGALSFTVAPSTAVNFFGTATPTATAYNENTPVELGMKFQATTAGSVTALRYFRASADSTDTDTRQGHLWASDGTLLGTVTFTSGPGQSGWQQMALSSPVTLQVGATYIVSYNTANNYLATGNYFTSAVTDPSGQLTAPSNAASGGNGVYAYGSALQFPNQTYLASNYWVDVSFTAASNAPTPPTGLALDPISDSGQLGDRVTNNTGLMIDGAASAGATVTLYEGVNVVGSAVADSTGAFRIPTTALAQGVHSLTATATVGSVTSQASAPITITVDTTAPVAPTNLADAAIAGGTVNGAGNTASQTLTGVAEKGATVTVFDNGTKLGTATADAATGQFSYPLGVLGQGGHSLTATATDPAGNAGPASTALVFTVDSAPPVVTAKLVSDTGTSASDGITSNPSLSGTADLNATVTIKEGATVLGTALANGAGVWSYTPTLTDGAHTLTVNETDAAGNTGSATVQMTLDRSAPAVTARLVSDTGTSATDGITSNRAITGNGDPSATVTIKEGATVLGTAVANASGVWSYTPTLVDGAHTLTASETDAAGNTGSATVQMTLDRVAPSPVILNAANGTPATYSGTSEPGSVVTVLEGTTVRATATADATGAWSVSTGTLSNAVHTLTAKATDAAGNTGSSPGNTYVGTSAANTLTGSANADVLLGGGGADSLGGAGGADRLLGGPGADTMAGGAGADTFAFGPGFGLDRVNDFAPGTDHLEFSRALFTAGMSDTDIFNYLISHATTAGTATILNIDAADTVRLQAVTLTSLHQTDFIFV
jgi:hypothetical protein